MTLSTTDAVHSLAGTLERTTKLSTYINLELGAPAGENWFTPAELLSKHTPHLDEMWGRIAAHYETTDKGYLKQTVFGNAIWQPVVSGLACYLADRRVPDLSAGNVVLHLDAEGWVDRVALKAPRFACLPDDPAATDPQAVVVPDLDALRRFYLQGLLTEYLELLMETMKSRYKYGLRAMQETLADRVVGTLIWLLKELGEAGRVYDEVAAFSALLPFKTKSGVLEIPYGGRCELFLKRASCCLSYKLPQYSYCTSCPLQSEEERVRRFQAYLADPNDD